MISMCLWWAGVPNVVIGFLVGSLVLTSIAQTILVYAARLDGDSRKLLESHGPITPGIVKRLECDTTR